MFIKRNAGARIELALSIAVLAVIGLSALAVGYFLGTEAAVATAVLLFLLLDGFACLWTVLTWPMNRRIADRLDAEDEQRLQDGSRHNPTLR